MNTSDASDFLICFVHMYTIVYLNKNYNFLLGLFPSLGLTGLSVLGPWPAWAAACVLRIGDLSLQGRLGRWPMTLPLARVYEP